MSSFSENNDYDDILQRLLDRIPNDLDKRQGSIIYDALAPVAAELAQCYIALDVYADQTYLNSAVGENLDDRVADYGITRQAATPAIRIGRVYDENDELMEVEIGTRFSTPNENGGYNFEVTEELGTGSYLFTCETPGTGGNEYLGELLPLTSVNNLGRAELIGTQTPGENDETDDELRSRTINIITQKSFAGNKASYLEYMNSISGVGIAKIFPVWNGGGTVKIDFITSDYKIPTAEFVNQVQTLIDPIQNQGEGIGLAPIGHTVTVEAPVKLNINIDATIELDKGITIGAVQSLVEESLEEYLLEVQKEWSEDNKLYIYISRVIAAILQVDGVINVQSVEINGSPIDLEIEITSENVVFPMLNEVVLNEG